MCCGPPSAGRRPGGPRGRSSAPGDVLGRDDREVPAPTPTRGWSLTTSAATARRELTCRRLLPGWILSDGLRSRECREITEPDEGDRRTAECRVTPEPASEDGHGRASQQARPNHPAHCVSKQRDREDTEEEAAAATARPGGASSRKRRPRRRLWARAWRRGSWGRRRCRRGAPSSPAGPWTRPTRAAAAAPRR